MHRAIKALAIACFAGSVYAQCAPVVAESRSVASAISGDQAAVAKFLEIGFANAKTKFQSLRGAQIKGEIYVALKWPDRTHFANCRVFTTTSKDSYSCESTLRDDNTDDNWIKLFKMASAAMQAELPAGYTSDGMVDEGGGSGILHQIWVHAGSPDLTVYETPSGGKVEYLLIMSVPK